MITVIAEIKVRSGHLAEIVKRFQALQAEVLAEEGCYQYAPLTDTLPAIEPQTLAPDTIFMLERWESHAHLDAHLKTAHMVRHHKETQDQVESVTLRILTDRSAISTQK